MQQQQYSGDAPVDSTYFQNATEAAIASGLLQNYKQGASSLTDEVAWQIENLHKACGSISLIIMEANYERSNGEAGAGIGHFFSMIESQLRMLQGVVENGLKDKHSKPLLTPIYQDHPQGAATSRDDIAAFRRECFKFLDWSESDYEKEVLWQAICRVVKA